MKRGLGDSLTSTPGGRLFFNPAAVEKSLVKRAAVEGLRRSRR
jgi:hypothetical protein